MKNWFSAGLDRLALALYGSHWYWGSMPKMHGYGACPASVSRDGEYWESGNRWSDEEFDRLREPLEVLGRISVTLSFFVFFPIRMLVWSVEFLSGLTTSSFSKDSDFLMSLVEALTPFVVVLITFTTIEFLRDHLKHRVWRLQQHWYSESLRMLEALNRPKIDKRLEKGIRLQYDPQMGPFVTQTSLDGKIRDLTDIEGGPYWEVVYRFLKPHYERLIRAPNQPTPQAA